jgi:hypothetical protein
MKNLILTVLLCFPVASFAKSSSAKKMDVDLMEFLMQTLTASKPEANLLCEVKVRSIRQERKFSNETRWVEMIELQYQTNRDHLGQDMKTYFPLGSLVTRKIVNSEFSGPVEEVSIESADRLSKTFTFQHDGRGQIISMVMADELRLLPCQLRRR